MFHLCKPYNAFCVMLNFYCIVAQFLCVCVQLFVYVCVFVFVCVFLSVAAVCFCVWVDLRPPTNQIIPTHSAVRQGFTVEQCVFEAE